MDSMELDGIDILRLHHIGIATTNSLETCVFYCDCLGFAQVSTQDFLPQQVRVSLLRKGDEMLEVLEPIVPDCATGRFLAKRGPGIHHVCYEVSDIQRVLDLLLGKAVRLVHNQVEDGIFGPVLFIHPKFSHGVMVELLQTTVSEQRR